MFIYVGPFTYNNPDLLFGSNIGEILNDYQGKKFGLLLMSAVVKWLLEYNYDSLILWTFEFNHRARNWYEKLGGSYLQLIHL